MRITINTLSVTPFNAGTRTLLRGLVGGLMRVDRRNTYRLVCSRANRHLFAAFEPAAELVVVDQRRRRRLGRVVHDQLTVPWLARRGTDVLVTPSTVGSLLAPVPQVVIVVAHLALPELRREAGVGISAHHRIYYGPLMRWTHRRAAAVVGISESLARSLRAAEPAVAAKVAAIPCGIDPLDPPAAGPAGGGCAARPFALFVGTLFPYKGPAVLVRALAEARTRLPDGFRAVIAGRDPDGRQVPELRRLASALGVADSVELVGRVDDATLQQLYEGATAVVFASRAEGFGFPALEAMARGVPVVAADRTSLPEIVGSAGILVDPHRPSEVADALVRIATEAGLAERLATAGRARAAELTWDRAAEAYVDLFERLGRG